MDPIEQLRLYRERANRLLENQLVKSGFDASSTIEFENTEAGPVLTVKMKEPPTELLTALLVVLRQFLNNDEPINQNRVFNTLELHLTDDSLRGELRKARKHWNEMLREDAMRLVYNEKELSPEFITDMWINDTVHSYIRDPQKAEILQHMLPHERAIMRAKFFACVNNAIQIVNFVQYAVSRALDEDLIDLTRTAKRVQSDS
jgi:hypothetical protein